MKALYTYFGQLDLHTVDTPGHSLYQLGLLDSIKSTWNEELVFDFYSYYPESVKSPFHLYPDTPHGELFSTYFNSLIDQYDISKNDVLQKISDQSYDYLFLKARFRNLSTLSKKWKDARDFEVIIDHAVLSGYEKHQIIILDTDLSLSEVFTSKYLNVVTIVIPSIDFPGISTKFLLDCVNLAKNEKGTFGPSLVYYGNINTSNYKDGNQKNSILTDVLNTCKIYYGEGEAFYLINKRSDFDEWYTDDIGHRTIVHIHRWDRPRIFDILSTSMAMINVTKDKYNQVKFIPARIYEAMIFGMIPISFRFNWLSETFSFETLEDFDEICKYLFEVYEKDRLAAYLHFINDYINYVDSLVDRLDHPKIKKIR